MGDDNDEAAPSQFAALMFFDEITRGDSFLCENKYYFLVVGGLHMHVAGLHREWHSMQECQYMYIGVVISLQESSCGIGCTCCFIYICIY